jgi:hypothetical protein
MELLSPTVHTRLLYSRTADDKNEQRNLSVRSLKLISLPDLVEV